ncbi:MAG: hypothetical protein WC788_08075 [Candidatus Paceibacterota bacterium]|jgi:hypothetical protein
MPKIDITKLSKEITDKYSIVNESFAMSKIKNAELDKYDGKPKDELNIIVGDDKQPDKFYPQVKLCRWSNEVNFSVRLIDTEVGEETVKTDKDKIIWEKGNIKIENYDYVEGEGGYKLVWFLKKKPQTNKVEFTIQSKGLDFFYQPELTPEEIAEGAFRPPEVVGSYAVYHQTKGGMVDKFGKAYATGKAFHIYRPHLFDSNGLEAWGNLHIENGIYSVEIPQDFLDNAVYPIRSNDTFGYTTIGASKTANVGINSIRTWTHSPASSGTVTSISIYCTGRNDAYPTKYIRPVIYLDSSKARLGDGSQITVTDFTTPVWYSGNVSSSVTSSTNYRIGEWLGVETGGSYSIQFYYDTGLTMYIDNYAYHATNTPVDPLVDDSSTANIKASIYATYTPSGGTAVKDIIQSGLIAFAR